MPQAPLRRHPLGVNLLGLLLLLIVGAGGQGALYWMEAFDTDGQPFRQALQHQQQARQALDGLRTGIEQALQPLANVEQEALTQDEASLFLDAHATALGSALTALEALPLNERSRSALQALKPILKGRLADIQGVALIGLKTGSTKHLPAIRRALDALTHELDQFQALLLTELQAGQQDAASARQQLQIALAALMGLCMLTLLAIGAWQRRKLPDRAALEDTVPLPPKPQSQATDSATAVAAAAPVAAPKPAAQPVSAPNASVVTSTPGAAAVTPKPVEPKSAAPVAAAAPAGTAADAVSKTIATGAHAWSRKDVKGYLSQYASDFKTPKGIPRKAWEEEREDRIAGKPGKISVSYDEPQISINGDRATAKFRQHYKSSSLSGSTNKTLVFVRSGNRWLIQEENAR